MFILIESLVAGMLANAAAATIIQINSLAFIWGIQRTKGR
jgi:hypothetical protein